MLSDIFVDFVPPDSEERTHNRKIDITNAAFGNLAHSGETGGASATEEIDEESFDEVIRVVGEMASVREQFTSEREMFDFEAMFNMVGKRFPCVAVCQYDARKFSGQAVLAALRAHPDIFDVAMGLLLK